jgi:hypothetical protein
MFEVNMDEYLEEEIEYIKNNLNSICADWEKQVRVNPAQRPLRCRLTRIRSLAHPDLLPKQKPDQLFCLPPIQIR